MTQPPLARRFRHHQIRAHWRSGIRIADLSLAGYSTNTAGVEAGATFLGEFGWSENTWHTRASQLAKWLAFCDEDMRPPLSAQEGDVLAYIVYLSLEGSISPDSLPQYVSAVSRYHELHH